MRRRLARLGSGILAAGLAASLIACSGGGSQQDGDGGAAQSEEIELSAGWVSAIDQIGLPAALDQGFFEDEGLDVAVAEPFASGVDQLNALETDQIQFAQVGAPLIGAVLKGADYVIVGNYTGSAAQLGIDETMAIVAKSDAGVSGDDLSSLRGKRLGVTVGSINHLYLLALLEDNGMTPDDVEIVNTAATDLAVALQTDGIDAAVIWDPWPMTIEQQVEGTETVLRGGGYIGFMGYIVAKRDFVEQNPDAVERFLRARAAADQWMRENPDDAAQTATRWLSGMDEGIAQEAMAFNIKQLDGRISACNFQALSDAEDTLFALGSIDGTFDVNEVFVPGPINTIADESPELFEDLAAVPDSARITDGFVFDPAAGMCG
ncbi:ABC transporter substrate-binding protein [Leucobacter muris]|uniref:ABC transporter substrate-binding protein n=1 Tax=Leucobacter muris TaxID=1935379 RepID=A0ABX5QIM8_9MICO|nr:MULTISPECIES: ABC transporter substrate-binding protein [Leucobacter]QAB18957.1 ABC transporter substrate-binding protein [Leucobacter muris]